MKKKNWMQILLRYAKKSKMKIILSVLFSILSVLSGLVPYLCTYKLIEQVIYQTVSVNSILMWCGIAVGTYLLKALFFGISTTFSHVGAYNILENLRMSVANKFLNAPLGTVASKPIGEIKNMIVDRIENIEPSLAHLIPEFTGNFILPITVFIILMVIDWRLALSALITIPFTMIIFKILMKKCKGKFEEHNRALNNVSSVMVEYIEGIQVIKAFNQTGKSYNKFSSAINNYKDATINWMKSTWVEMKLAFALFPSTLLGTLPVGLILYTDYNLSPASVAIGIMLSLSMVGSLARLEAFSEQLRQTKSVLYDTSDFLDMEELKNTDKEVELDNYNIEMKNVCFSYDGKKENEVLHNINLKFNQDSFTALVGPSGGGKSTIARLVSRFWDVNSGEILIGGKNIKEIPLSQLSGCISFVTQDNFLFNCSLLENIRLGNPNATDEEVYKVAQKAQCDEFIKKLDKGYETSAGEAGNLLSGGEKQRIAIARMMLKNAPVVILDEATAFTDPENEYKIQQAITELTKNKTLIVIAHRLSTIKNSDNIIVLENGKIKDQGTQNELLKNSELYKDMWKAHIGAKSWAVSKEVKNV